MTCTMKTLNQILTKNLIVYSNIDETIIHDSQQWEQEEMHRYLNYGQETELPEDMEIRKTLLSGSSWMR